MPAAQARLIRTTFSISEAEVTTWIIPFSHGGRCASTALVHSLTNVRDFPVRDGIEVPRLDCTFNLTARGEVHEQR